MLCLFLEEKDLPLSSHCKSRSEEYNMKLDNIKCVQSMQTVLSCNADTSEIGFYFNSLND
jgi:hypothetical protein